MSKRIIKVVNYSEHWHQAFTDEKTLLESVLASDNLVGIHHIGSTSVTGLCAKPVIDMLVEVKNLTMLDSYNQQMALIGYLAKGEYGIAGRRYFQKGKHERSHQIHAFEFGSFDVVRHLAFRDYLIAFPDIAKQYGLLKQEGARVCANNIDVYCDHKDSFLKEHEANALHWKTLSK